MLSLAAASGLPHGPLPAPSFRFVLPRAKQARLARRLATLERRRPCPVPSCGLDGLAVVLVELEADAVLCRLHELVDNTGALIPGQPTIVTSAW